jgi:hypothetical protein
MGMAQRRRARRAGILLVVMALGSMLVPPTAFAQGKNGEPGLDAVKAVSKELVGYGVAATACFVAVAIALGGLEGQIGAMFQIPGFNATAKVRVVVCVVALLIAVSAIPVSNFVIDKMSSAGLSATHP